MSTLQTLTRKEIAAVLGYRHGMQLGIGSHGKAPMWWRCLCAVCGVAYRAELRRVAEAEASAS